MSSSSSPPPPSAPPSASSGSRAPANGSAAHDPAVGDDELSSAEMKQLLATVLKDRTAEGGAVAKSVSSVPGDTCTWYATKQCSVARSCYDCLNTRLAGDAQVCMVDALGVCVSMSQYKPDKDFRRARPANTVGTTTNQYPSTNATYCANDDQYCAICRDNWGNPFDNSQLSYLPFCRGVGGCVCIQACESPYHNDNVIMQRCVAYGYTAPSAKTVYTSIGFMAALCCVVAIVTFVIRRWLRRARAFARPAYRPDQPLPQREPTGPQLGLSGWHSMREKLIETEREQLQRVESQALAVPVIENTTSTAVAIEPSDEYLPGSPRGPHHEETGEDDADAQLRRRASSEPTSRTAAATSSRPVNEL